MGAAADELISVSSLTISPMVFLFSVHRFFKFSIGLGALMDHSPFKKKMHRIPNKDRSETPGDASRPVGHPALLGTEKRSTHHLLSLVPVRHLFLSSRYRGCV